MDIRHLQGVYKDLVAKTFHPWPRCVYLSNKKKTVT